MNTARREYTELNDTAYVKFRHRLLQKKGNARQREFLERVRDTDAFLRHMSLIETVGNTDPALALEPMTEDQYKDPPADTEQALFSVWRGFTPAVASRSTFWAHLTICHIRAGLIQSVYLAANGGGASGGAARIDKLLNASSTEASSKIDACVRTVLRRLGGLREVRGNRSVLVDCPLARAWWRERFVGEAACGDINIATAVRGVLRTNQTYWEKFIDRVVFRNSTFGSENVRRAFLRVLGRYREDNPSSRLLLSSELQVLCRRATAYQGSRELSILRDGELESLMGIVVERWTGR